MPVFSFHSAVREDFCWPLGLAKTLLVREGHGLHYACLHNVVCAATIHYFQENIQIRSHVYSLLHAEWCYSWKNIEIIQISFKHCSLQAVDFLYLEHNSNVTISASTTKIHFFLTVMWLNVSSIFFTMHWSLNWSIIAKRSENLLWNWNWAIFTYIANFAAMSSNCNSWINIIIEILLKIILISTSSTIFWVVALQGVN